MHFGRYYCINKKKLNLFSSESKPLSSIESDVNGIFLGSHYPYDIPNPGIFGIFFPKTPNDKSRDFFGINFPKALIFTDQAHRQARQDRFSSSLATGSSIRMKAFGRPFPRLVRELL